MNLRNTLLAIAALAFASVAATPVEADVAAPAAALSRRFDCDQYNSYSFGQKVIGGQGATCAPLNSHFTACTGFDSPDQHYYFIQQNDGNLVIYHHGDHGVVWASNKYGHTGVYTIFQGDGNLVQYDQFGTVLWASNTDNRGASDLCIQDDSNLVIYSSGGQALWALFDGNGRIQH